MNPVAFLKSKAGAADSTRRRYIHAVLWSVVAAVASRSITLCTTIACARFLGKAGFGQFGIVQNTANMVAVLAALGLGITATRYIADLRERDPERAGRIVGMAWLMGVVSGLILTAVSIVSAPWMARELLHAGNLAGPLRIASALVFLNSLLAFQNGALAGFEAFKRLATINIISGLISVPLIVIGVWKFGLYGAVTGTALAQGVNWLLNERLLVKECRRAGIRISTKGALREMEVFWSFSLPALLGSLSTAPVFWFCSVLIVRSRNGFDQMALYSGADRWRLAILFIPTALFQSALPMLSNMHKSNPEGYDRVAKANLWVNMAVVVLPILGIAALSPQIMSTYGKGFRSGWPVLAVICIGTLPEALNTIFGYPLIAKGRMWARFWYDILLTLVLLGMAMWMIPSHGAFGYAIAYIVAFSVTSAALYIDILVTRSRITVADSSIPFAVVEPAVIAPAAVPER